MIRKYRVSATAVVLACLLAAPVSSRAAEPSPSADNTTAGKQDVSAISLPGTTEFVRSVTQPSPPMLAGNSLLLRSPMFAPDADSAFAQRGYRGRGGRGRHDGAMAAILLGAAAAIAGTAVLVYANRPDCRATPQPGGCGYGTKVVGGSVLSAGLVGVVFGAATWR